MPQEAQVEIGKRPIAAKPEDVIPAGRKIITKEVVVGLVKKPTVEPFVPTPGVPAAPGLPFFPRLPARPYYEEVVTKPLILNIETLGLNPFKNRIISIGLQDPEDLSAAPLIIMENDEAQMLNKFFAVVKAGGYNELVGYSLSFDYRFILIKAMKHGLTCKEFYNMDLYDLMQVMAQGKQKYVYFPQKPPKLSDVADYFWGYPKPFTDLEMMKYYAAGRYDKVVEFATSQIIRTMALYSLFRYISETSISSEHPGSVSAESSFTSLNNPTAATLLTIPEAQPKKTWTAKCPECLAEREVPIGTEYNFCEICKAQIRK